MTLEDFFTLREMKDGLTAPSRVEELLKLMQSEKDSNVNNAGEATRQWIAVASTIAATENKDCLDLFIQLDGVLFVNKWLKDAHNLDNDTNQSFVEDSITALLRALDKLQIDNKRSMSTGIWSTVERLLKHRSLKVQDLARLLFDSWKPDGDAVDHDAENTGVLCGDGSSAISVQESKPSALDISSSEVVSNSESCPSSTAQVETLPLSSLESQQPEIAVVQISACNVQPSAPKILEIEDLKDSSPDPLGSVTLEAVQRSPIKKASSVCSLETNAALASSDLIVAKMSSAGVSDGLKSDQMPRNEKEKHTVYNPQRNLGVTVIPSVSGPPLESGVVSSDTNAATPHVFVNDSVLQQNRDAKEDGFRKLDPLSGDGQYKICISNPLVVRDGGTDVLDDKTVVMGDAKTDNHCNSAVQDNDCPNLPQESSSKGSLSGKIEDIETSTRIDDPGAVDEDEGQDSDEDNELTITSVFPSQGVFSSKGVFPSNIFEKRRSDIDVEYGMVDALEVARQVAQEVEREVVDYREPNCSSSSDRLSGGGLRQPGSSDSINENKDPLTKVGPKDLSVEQLHSVEANPANDVVESEHQEMVPEHTVHDRESSQVTETAQDPEVNSEKGLCGFDLNEEVSSDEMDCSVNPVSAPIPFSRPPPAAHLPVAPLQFEGPIGLKGSLGNSAFRRASPRRVLESEKISAGATTDSSKKRLDSLCLDLNVAFGADDLEKQIPLSSGLPSEESSGEVSQIKLGRPNLDLNRIDDDDALPMNLRVSRQFLYNGNPRRSPSPASSSSSMQPSTKNFDLNDRPFFLDDSIDQGHGKAPQNAIPFKGQLDGSVISIMGTRVELKRNDVHQTFSITNGKGVIEPAGDPYLARAGSLLELGSRVSYNNAPIFGYNGLAAGPTMSFPSTMYGHGGTIPYLMDSRGSPVPVVPQVVGSAPAVPPLFSQSPFFMSLNGMQPGPNGVGPPRPSFDLNSGFMVESGNRDSGLRHLFIHGQGSSMDEHLRNSLQPPSSSNVGGKRKETEGGLELFPLGYKHPQSPWR